MNRFASEENDGEDAPFAHVADTRSEKHENMSEGSN